MRIEGLDHVQLAMPPGGEAQARAFYAGVLGLQELEKPEPLRSRGGCWFQGPGFQVHVGVEQGFRPARKAHPAFAVRDLAAAQVALAAAGAAIRHDTSLPATPRLFTDDPFGNRIELMGPAGVKA